MAFTVLFKNRQSSLQIFWQVVYFSKKKKLLGDHNIFIFKIVDFFNVVAVFMRKGSFIQKSV